MTPVITAVRMSGAAHRAELPLLVLGPSLGTSAATLWTECAASGLTDAFDVLAWDLPGHGHNRSVPDESWTVADLARGVLAVVDDVLEQRGEAGGSFAYAGDSAGGVVGLQLLLDAPARVEAAVLVCTGAQIGAPEFWTDRIERVRASGTAAMVPGSAERWFAPDFLDRRPSVGTDLLVALQDTLDEGYVQVCRAIAEFDVRDRLGEIAAPVLAVAGAVDAATPPALLEEIATGVRDGRLVVLPDVAHLAPAEAPDTVAALVREHVLGEAGPEVVVGDPVGFEEQLASYADAVESRPGLDPRIRALVTLTALIARGHHDELPDAMRTALHEGLGVEELREVLLQIAVDCGVHVARAAHDVAERVLAEGGVG